MNAYPELKQIEDALVGAAARRVTGVSRGARRQPRFVLTAGLLLALLLGGAAIAGAAGEGPLADQLNGLFGSDVAPPAPTVPIPGSDETKGMLGIPRSAPGRVLLTAPGDQPKVVDAYAKNGQVCLVISGFVHHTGGNCVDTLREAGGHLSVMIEVVDSQPFVYGLAANDVTGVTVTIDGHDYVATLSHNAFYVGLPSQQVASHPMTITAQLADGTTRAEHAPGVPTPIRRPAG